MQGISVGGVSDADYGIEAERGVVRVIGVGDASYKSVLICVHLWFTCFLSSEPGHAPFAAVARRYYRYQRRRDQRMLPITPRLASSFES